MGGEHDRLTAAEAASVLGWWIEAGVDTAVQDAPRAWLGGEIAPAIETPPAATSETAPALPESLEAFRGWLSDSPALPFAKGNGRRALPKGAEAA